MVEISFAITVLGFLGMAAEKLGKILTKVTELDVRVEFISKRLEDLEKYN